MELKVKMHSNGKRKPELMFVSLESLLEAETPADLDC